MKNKRIMARKKTIKQEIKDFEGIVVTAIKSVGTILKALIGAVAVLKLLLDSLRSVL